MGAGRGDRRRQEDASRAAVAREDFAAAMRAMAKLRPHVDAFFDKVTVNVDDKQKLRENRLQAAQRNPRGDPRRRGFLADRGLDPSRESCSIMGSAS